jgi:peptide/nickel transport system substrate-binding protein
VVKTDTTDFNQFNGTGPFKVVDYSPEDRLVLEANESYFVEGEPKLAGLEIIFFNDDTAKVDALRGGQIDMTMALSTDLWSSLEGEDTITLLDAPTNQFDLVRLRSDRAPGDDPRVMQALKLATDRDAVYELVLGGFGRIGRDSPIGPLYTQYYSEETFRPRCRGGQGPAGRSRLCRWVGAGFPRTRYRRPPRAGGSPERAVG